MPIKEEPVRIEFQYEQEDPGEGDGIFNVEYFSETVLGKEKKYLSITPSGCDTPSTFEVDFLVEVVDFLRKKGVAPAPPLEIDESKAAESSSLRLPKVQTISNAGNVPAGLKAPVVEKAPMFFSPLHSTENAPVTSFTVDEPISESAIISRPVQGKGPTVISAPTVISTDSNSPIINRPVIRTKLGANEDAMATLVDSQRQRGTNSAKSIKRSEASDEV